MEKIRKYLPVIMCLTIAFVLQIQMITAYGEDTDPLQDDPIETGHILSGTLYLCDAKESADEGTPLADEDIDIELADDTVTVNTDVDGEFSYTLSDEEIEETGIYHWTVESTDEHYSASGTLTENEDEELFVRRIVTLSGTLYETDGAGSDDDAIPLSEETIKIELAEKSATVDTDENGEFTYSVPKDELTASDEYTWYVKGSDTHYAASGTLKANKEQALYVRNIVTLAGRIYEYTYKASADAGTPMTRASITMQLKTGPVDIMTDDNGSFELKLEKEQLTEDGDYAWSTVKTDTHYAASGIIGENASYSLFIRKIVTLTGTVYEYDYDEAVCEEKILKNYRVKLSLGTGTVSVTTDSDGRFSHTLTVSEAMKAGEYTWTTDAADTYYASTGTIKENVPGILFVQHKRIVSGTIYEYAFSESKNAGTRMAGVPVKIEVSGGSVTETTSSNGTFSHIITKEEALEDAEYNWSIDKTEDHYKAEGTIKENETGTLYVRERYIASESDYRFSSSANVINGYVNTPGSYTIEPVMGRKLSDKLDGEEKDSVTVDVDDKGNISSFYVYADGLCSKVFTGGTIKVDDGPPVVSNVSTAAAATTTFVKGHGIYSKIKAELLVNATVTENGVGLRDVYIIRVKDGKETRYDAYSVTGHSGRYNVTIGLPDASTIMDAEVVRIVADDLFGNRSAEMLLAKTQDGSSVTLEEIPPAVTQEITGKHSSFGWYSELPTLSATAYDNLSGLYTFSITGEGFALATESYSDKTRSSHTITGQAKLKSVSDDGSYTYKVEATDNSGNAAISEYNIKVDLTAPKIEADGVTSGEYYRKSPNINITEDEKYYKEEGNRIKILVTRNNSVTALDRMVTGSDHATIGPGTFKRDGVYRIKIQAIDAADNESNVITYKFVKDATAPKVTLSGVREGKFYNKKQAVSLTVLEHNYKTNKVSVSAMRKLGKSTKSVGFPWSNKSGNATSVKTFSETGTYIVKASAVDKAGNRSKEQKISFTVDTEAPVINISGVKDGAVYTYGHSVSPKIEISDDYLESKSIVYTKAGSRISAPSFSQEKKNDGVYTLTAAATDKAGNSTTKVVNFTINRFGSSFEYNDAIKSVMGKALQSIDQDLIITEKNTSKLDETNNRILLDGRSVENTAETSEAGRKGNYTYKHNFSAENFKDEGAYEINVVSKDDAGNEMESKEENGKVAFYVDRTAPSITVIGIDPKGIRAESATLTVKATDLLTGVTEIRAKVGRDEYPLRDGENGEKLLTLKEGLRQDIRIFAVDKAGNEAEYEDTVSVSPSSIRLFFDRFDRLIGILMLVATALVFVVLAIIKLRHRDDDEEEEETVAEHNKEETVTDLQE